MNAPDFERAFQAALEVNPVLQTFVQTLDIWGVDSLVGDKPGKTAVKYLVDLLKANPELLVALNGILQALTELVNSGVITPSIPGVDPNTWKAKEHIVVLYAVARVQAAAQSEHYQQAGLTSTLVAHYVNAMATALKAGGTAAQAAYYASYVLTLWVTRFLHPTEGFANTVAQVATIGMLVNAGWQITWAGLIKLAPIQNLFGEGGLDFVATKTIAGRETAAFIHVQAKLSSEEIDKVARILSSLAEEAYKLTLVSQAIGSPMDGIALLIAYNSDQNTVEQLLQRLGTTEATVVIIWMDNQNVVHATGKCGQSGCPGGKSAQDYANSVANALGLTPGQPYSSSPLAATGLSFEFFMDLYQGMFSTVCAGDAACALYHLKWWLKHYSCMQPGGARFQVLSQWPICY